MAVSRGSRLHNSDDPHFLAPIKGVPDGMIEEFDIAIEGFKGQDNGFTTLTFNCSDEGRKTNFDGSGEVVWKGLHFQCCNKCSFLQQLLSASPTSR